jgi:Uma2 family endonuclease
MPKTAIKKTNVRFNYEDYLLLPENKHYEILAGDLRAVPAPSTRRQTVSLNLAVALVRQVKEKKLGRVFHTPRNVILSHEDIVHPDIIFVRHERKCIIGELEIQGAPDLAVEIFSRDASKNDFKAKRKIYMRHGVLEYWIVDPDTESVEVLAWSELGYISAGNYCKTETLLSPLFPGLRLSISDVFAD